MSLLPIWAVQHLSDHLASWALAQGGTGTVKDAAAHFGVTLEDVHGAVTLSHGRLTVRHEELAYQTANDPCPQCGGLVVTKWSGVECMSCEWTFCL